MRSRASLNIVKIAACALGLLASGAPIALGEGKESKIHPVVPPGEIVGHWQGHGRIANKWTNVQQLPMDFAILPDGRVVGMIGDAQVRGGLVMEKQAKRGPEYHLLVDLEGPLLDDGLMRRSLDLVFSASSGRLTGTGTTDGGKPIPIFGSSRDVSRESKRLELDHVLLVRGAAR